MPPTKACSYKEHDNLKKSTGKIPIQNIKTYKKFKKSVLSFLISKGFLEAHHNFCVMIVMTTVCVKLTLKIYGKRTLWAYKWWQCKWEWYVIIMQCRWWKIQEDIEENSYSSLYGKREGLKCRQTARKHRPWRVYILSALFGEPYEQKVQILNAYEHISNLSNSYYIGPLNFALNILFHYITGSKQVLEMRPKYSPSGSYTKALQ